MMIGFGALEWLIRLALCGFCFFAPNPFSNTKIFFYFISSHQKNAFSSLFTVCIVAKRDGPINSRVPPVSLK